MRTPQKAGHRPIILGIVGDSAAGKTTLTKGLANLFGPDRVTHICTDDYHKFDRVQRSQMGITALHPDCNYLDIIEQHLERLHYGQPILKPVYDHSTGSLVRPVHVQPQEFVIVEGLLGFHSAVMRQFYDVKVFLDPPEDLRKIWKIKRDTTKRGYNADQVIAELEKREPDSRDYIRPQREFADVIVRFHPPEGVQAQQANGHLNVRLVLRPTIPHPDLSYLLEEPETRDSGVRLGLGRDCGRPVDILEIDGNVTSAQVEEFEESIRKHSRDVRPVRADRLGAYQDRTESRHSDPLALTQLLLTYHLLRAYGGEQRTLFARSVFDTTRSTPLPGGVSRS